MVGLELNESLRIKNVLTGAQLESLTSPAREIEKREKVRISEKIKDSAVRVGTSFWRETKKRQRAVE
jgi:hypothetical protein